MVIKKLYFDYSSFNSLEQISIDADLPLGLVVQLVAHLIEWRMAIAIAPLSENNVYSTSLHAQEIM